MSDYIHRAGRVGRVGSKHMGHVTSLVTYAWDVDLLWKIEVSICRTLVKSEKQKNIFLIFKPKHMLWVLKRTVSMRRFF